MAADDPVVLDQQVWAIDGVKTDASVARAEAHRRTGGARGISLPGDLEVLALDTPDGAVQILPGGGTTPNDYVPNAGQSYGMYTDKTTQLAIPETDSSAGVTRYVVWGIHDPVYEGQTPSCGFYLEADLDSISYPHIPLARIDQPKSTSAILNKYITDLRKVANPQQLTVPFVRNSLSIDTGQTLNSSTDVGEYFPDAGSFDVDIPLWATRVIITNATWYGVQIPTGNNVWGTRWIEFGRKTGPHSREVKTQEIRFDSIGKGGNSREDWGAAGDAHIPKAIRGTTQPFGFHAKYSPNSADKGVVMDGLSGVSVMLTFQEVADSNVESRA